MFRCRAASSTWSPSWIGSVASCSVGNSPTRWRPASAWPRWRAAFRFGQPEIWNSDQGSQFTAADFLAPLKKRGISISMDGRGRALDNVFIERLWRSSEVRADLPRRLRQRGRTVAGAGSLLPFLQSPASAPGARLPHAGRTVPATVNKEKSVVMMGGSAPQTPRDLALFLPEWMILFFADSRSCRTMERLDRRIGQRRDATRAPTQARNGWRPSGRLLVTPPHHLSTADFLSNLWGPPHIDNLPRGKPFPGNSPRLQAPKRTGTSRR